MFYHSNRVQNIIKINKMNLMTVELAFMVCFFSVFHARIVCEVFLSRMQHPHW
jgi:hypothetical protein